MSTNSNESLYWLIMQLSHQTRANLVKVAEEFNLTGIQAHLLCGMNPDILWPMQKATFLLRCDKSYVTGIVDNLLLQGLITRQEDHRDRRIKMISLTEKGKSVRAKLFEKTSALESAIDLPLTHMERQKLRQLLMKAVQEI